MQELSKKSDEELEQILMIMAERGNMRALGLIEEVKKWRGQRVKVVKGRKAQIFHIEDFSFFRDTDRVLSPSINTRKH